VPPGERDVLGDGPHPFGIGDRRAAVLLDDEGHGVDTLPSALVLGRLVDESFAPEVRTSITLLTVARLVANACYRYAPPFLAVIARDLDVSLDELGVAIAISELAGLTAPLIGRAVDRVGRRTSTTAGLLGVGLGSAMAAASTGRWIFALALVVLAQSKVVFDLGLGSWIADHVPLERRGRIVGITETSWALGLLVGVSLLGVLTAVGGWRLAYVAGAAGVAAMSLGVRARLPGPAPHAGGRARHDGPRAGHVPRSTWRVVGAAFALMGASQCLFVTFGSWLEDTFGLGAVALSAVTFLLGGVELAASVTAARRADLWGKRATAAAGAALMVPSTGLLALWHDHLGVGLVLLAVAIGGFELAIVSALSLGASLVPGAPGRGLGLLLGAGTSGRALTAVVATRLYTAHGLTAPALVGTALAVLSAAAFSQRARHARLA